MRIEGDNRQKIRNALDKKMKAIVEVIGSGAESAARDLAPVDTGLLKNSITHGAAGGQITGATSYSNDAGTAAGGYESKTIPESASGAKYVAVVGTNVYYAPFQELGTSKMAAHPFLRPAFENNAGWFQTVAEEILKQETD